MDQSSVTIDHKTIDVHRSRLSGSLQPDLSIETLSLLGWRVTEPTNATAGWLHLLYAESDHNNYVHSFNEALVNPACLHFYPGEQDLCTAVNEQLTNLQAGYTVDTTEIVAENWEPQVIVEKPTQPEPKKEKTRAPWSRVATPDTLPEQNTNADIDGPIYDKVTVVTGDVDPYTKGEVWDMIANAGGVVAKNVTKKTNLLIVGEWATITSKEKRARELEEEGQDIRIWQLSEFLRTLGIEEK